MKNLACVLYTAFVTTASVGHSLAAPYTEPGDSGIREATAQILPSLVTSVNGTLKPGTTGPYGANPVDVDVFCFTLDQPVVGASIQVFAGFDANLLLLREGFFGVEGDDGGGIGGADSGIVRDLPAGTYYIAVGQNNIGAYDFTATMAGDDVWDNDSGDLNAVEAAIPIDFIGAESDVPTATSNNTYQVVFNFSTSVTGIDQSAGRKFSSLKGDDIINSSARGQLTRAKGTEKAKFKVLTQVTGGERRVKTTLRGKAARADIKVVATTGGKRKNVTAQLKSRGYRTNVESGGTIAYNVKVKRGNAPKLKQNFVLKALDVQDKSITDSAGAKVKLKG